MTIITMKHLIINVLLVWLICSAFGPEMCQGEDQYANLSSYNTSINESKAEYYNYWAIRFIEDGYYYDSLQCFNDSIYFDPNFSDAWNNKGFVWRRLGNYEEALKCYDKAIHLTPNSSIPWNNRGDCLYQLNNDSPALESFNRSLELDPQNALAWSNKGVVFSSRAQHKEALTCCDRALEIDVYNAEAWNGKGIVFANAGNLDQALSCFKNAADLRENYTEAWANGALALKQLGLESKSEQAYATARSLGYKNQTSPEFLANTEPQLMKEPEKIQDLPKKLPGFGTALALAILLVVPLGRRR